MSLNALSVLVGGGLCLFLAYLFYGRYLSRLYGVDPSRKTPAEERYDGIDYVPAKNWLVLFGHHFSSIAGAGPVIGPVLAVAYWGWGPVLLWIILGSIFFGGVHDFGALVLSLRHNGDSIAEVTGKIVSRRARLVFALFVWLALLLVIAIFAMLAAQTFVDEPSIVLPSLGLIPVAIFVGWLLYSQKRPTFPTTLIGLALLLLLLYLGEVFPIALAGGGFYFWLYLLLIYCFFASVAPVQILLQPRDYLSAFLLFSGLGVGIIGIFLTRPSFNTPFFIKGSFTTSPGGALFPMLLVTVACGAISGFHSLIASGTTSKQLATENDGRRIAYGGMLMEGLVALLALLAVSAGLGKTGKTLGEFIFSSGQPDAIGAFSSGYATLTWPILGKFGVAFAAVVLNAFILTTLDTATRIARYLTQELFGIKNRYWATLLVIFLAAWLTLSGEAKRLWPLFGGSNQLVAALALLVISCWLWGKRGITWPTVLPAIVVWLVTVWALAQQAGRFWGEKNYLLFFFSLSLVGLAIVMVIEVKRNRVRS